MARKAQLAFDFYVSLLVFIGILGYLTFQLFQIIPASSGNLKEESLRIEAYQISELLINDGGHPIDWHTVGDISNIKRIGLSDSNKNITNFLLRGKIDRFKTICNNNFNNIKNLLDIKDEINVTIIEHGPNVDVSSCASNQAKKVSFSVSRTVLISGTSYPTEIIVEVWKK
ncbi:MAG: hypothetical protein QW818_00215 [Candidatus Aenigmatarchaeota archaeon]|nr:hypothetical protein [Candidatus Aenigmarchaeota archaeon]